MLSKTFEMKDLDGASFVIGIEIQGEKFCGLLGLLSQNACIDHVSKIFNMDNFHLAMPLLLNKIEFSNSDVHREVMKQMVYFGSLMYAQVCTPPNIAYVINVLGRFQSNLEINH